LERKKPYNPEIVFGFVDIARSTAPSPAPTSATTDKMEVVSATNAPTEAAEAAAEATEATETASAPTDSANSMNVVPGGSRSHKRYTVGRTVESTKSKTRKYYKKRLY